MLPLPTLELRQRQVIEYLRLLPAVRSIPWLSAFGAAKTLPERLSLLHPMWLEGYAEVRAVQGPPGFPPPSSPGHCRSDLLWGYDCPLFHELVQADHVFPYALGGPTDGSNRLSLCRLHNGWKGADLAHFPWELGEPAWLPDQLATIRQRMRRR